MPLLQANLPGPIALIPTPDIPALIAANGGKYDIQLDPLWADEHHPDKQPPAPRSSTLRPPF